MASGSTSLFSLQARDEEFKETRGIDSNRDIHIRLHWIYAHRLKVIARRNHFVHRAVAVSDRFSASESAFGFHIHVHRFGFQE